MAIDIVKVTAERTPLDLLLWRHYRRDVPGLVEDTLARNPGLAENGVFLPIGTLVAVQTPAPDRTGRQAAPVMSLYD
jgi:phage tail protein X